MQTTAAGRVAFTIQLQQSVITVVEEDIMWPNTVYKEFWCTLICLTQVNVHEKKA